MSGHEAGKEGGWLRPSTADHICVLRIIAGFPGQQSCRTHSMSCGVAQGVMKGHRQRPRCCSPDARPGRASGAREGCPVTGTWGGHGKQTPQQDRSRGQGGRTPESRARPRPGAPGAQRHAWVAGARPGRQQGPGGKALPASAPPPGGLPPRIPSASKCPPPPGRRSWIQDFIST